MNTRLAIAISASIIILGAGTYIYIVYMRDFKPTAESAKQVVTVEINQNI